MARIELLADAAVMVLLMGWMSPPVGAQVVACASSSECAVGQTCYGTACAAARRRQLSRSSNARKRKVPAAAAGSGERSAQHAKKVTRRAPLPDVGEFDRRLDEATASNWTRALDGGRGRRLFGAAPSSCTCVPLPSPSPPPLPPPRPPPSPPACRGICAYVGVWSTDYPQSTFDIGTITVTLKEQWWISFEMRVNTNFVAGHNNMVNTAAGRYPGLYDNSDARGFCCSHEPGAPSISDQPNWGAAAGTDFLIEAKRTLQSDGTYLNQRIVDGVVLAEASGGAHGQTATTTFYMNYDYERPNAYVRNVDVWYYD